MSLSARFAKIKTGSAPKVGGSKSGNGGRGSAKKGVSVNNSKQAKLEAVKRAGKNKKADLLKSKRMGIKPKSLKEAAKGKPVAAKKKAKVVAGKAGKAGKGSGKGSGKGGEGKAGKAADKKKAKAADKKKAKKEAPVPKSADDLNMEMDTYFASKKADAPIADAAAGDA